MYHHSPLRYPGGKAKLSPFIQRVIEKNKLNDCVYLEPFAGGSGLALNLLINEYASKIILNDMSIPVYSFWHSVLHQNDELCEMVQNVCLNMNVWKKQKKIQSNPEQYETLEVGFSTLFLNRTNRSGILNGGVIGGVLQQGEWKIDARFNKGELIKRLKKITQYSNRIEVYNLEAMQFIRENEDKIQDTSLYFIDPPYYNKGQYLYDNYYKNEDHVDLYQIISKIKTPWVVTYDYNKIISGIYSKYPQRKYSLNYSAAENRRGTEIMIFSDALTIPRMKIV